MCCEIPDTGEVPWGFTLHPRTGWEKDIKFLGRNFAEAEAELQHLIERSRTLMTALEWVDRRTPDKRKRPPEARRAVKWLQERGLWDAYQAQYPDNSAQKRAYSKYNRKRKGRNVTVYVANEAQERYLAENRQADEAESAAIKRLAGFPKD